MDYREINNLIAKCIREETIEVVKQIPSIKPIKEFDWNIPKGADFDIDLHR